MASKEYLARSWLFGRLKSGTATDISLSIRTRLVQRRARSPSHLAEPHLYRRSPELSQ